MAVKDVAEKIIDACDGIGKIDAVLTAYRADDLARMALALLPLFPSLPPTATAADVIAEIAKGQEARRAWEAVANGKLSVRYEFGGWFVYGGFKAGTRDVSGNMAKDAHDPMVAVLSAIAATEVGK